MLRTVTITAVEIQHSGGGYWGYYAHQGAVHGVALSMGEGEAIALELERQRADGEDIGVNTEIEDEEPKRSTG